MNDFEARARYLVKLINNCNDESFDHPIFKASLVWEMALIADAFKNVRNESLDEAADYCKGLANTHRETAETAVWPSAYEHAEETALYCAEMIRALKEKDK